MAEMHLDTIKIWQIFQIGTVRNAEGLWRMRRHGPVIAHCTDSKEVPKIYAHIFNWHLIRMGAAGPMLKLINHVCSLV